MTSVRSTQRQLDSSCNTQLDDKLEANSSGQKRRIDFRVYNLACAPSPAFTASLHSSQISPSALSKCGWEYGRLS